MAKLDKNINGKRKFTPSDIVVHVILVILSVIWVLPVDHFDQLSWRKGTVCIDIASKDLYI